MQVTPTAYSESNTFQTQDAIGVIHRILEKYPNRYFPIIMDIGCGTGKVTDILKDTFPNSTIIAVDIDPAMIEFARNNSKHKEKDDTIVAQIFGKLGKNMEYLLQDFSQPWDNLRGEIQALEGKVDLIFSSLVFNWIPEVENVCYTIGRLLKVDGLIFANIATMQPVYSFDAIEKAFISAESEMPEEDGIHFNGTDLAFKYKFASENDQQEKWRDELNKNGVHHVEIESLITTWEIPKPEILVNLVTICRSWYMKFLQSDCLDKLNESEEGKLMNEMYEAVEKAHSRAICEEREEFVLPRYVINARKI